jgi:hypothetical protein
VRASLGHEIGGDQIATGVRKGEEDPGLAILDRLPGIVRVDMAEYLHVVADDEHVQLAGVMGHQLLDGLPRTVGEGEGQLRTLPGPRPLRRGTQRRCGHLGRGGMVMIVGIARWCLRVLVRVCWWMARHPALGRLRGQADGESRAQGEADQRHDVPFDFRLRRIEGPWARD